MAAIGLLDEVGVADAGAGLPATRPTLGAAEPLTGELVVNFTWGTVTWVERTEVVDELGMGEPDELPVEYVQGTVTVVWREIVVTGAAGAAGAAGAVIGELEDAMTGALEPAEDTAEEPVEETAEEPAEDTAEVAGVVTAGAVAAGVGTSVMVVGTLVMIPGFFST